MTFSGPAESICFVKSGDDYNQEIHLVVGVREDNYLHYICLNKESGFPYKTFNMNENGDDWVSFTAMELSVSPSGNHILCYTDSTSGRIIVFKSHSSEQVVNLYGTQIDSFSQPRACWHSNGHFVFATSDDHKIYVFDVVTGRVMSKLTGHEGVVRDLSFNSGKNILVSCGFDKTVRMWTS
jgi:COMPASS component SWD3